LVPKSRKKAKSSRAIVAAVDVGSNSIKMTVARRKGKSVKHLADASETVRLGTGLESSGALAQDRIEAAIDTLGRFAEVAREHGATRLIGVATEATRSAANGAAFLIRAREETGWDLRAISGDEEAALTFRGLAQSRDIGGTVVIADIGGGSTELIAAQGGRVALSRSIPLGSGRLTDRLIAHDPPTTTEIEACGDAATGQLGAIPFPFVAPDQLILLGGTAETLARLLPDPDRIASADLDGALDRLMAEPSAQISASTGIPDARARVLPAGIAIIRAMVGTLRPAVVSAAASGIRAGLILSALDEQEQASADPCETIRAEIARLWEDVWVAMPVAIAGEDPEGVHDMRVASRRLRAAMDIASLCFPAKWYRGLHKTARQITRSAGAVRDREVLLQFLRSERKKKITSSTRAAIDDWSAVLAVERESARDEMLAYLADLSKRDVPAEAKRRFASGDGSGGRAKRDSGKGGAGKPDASLIDPERSWAANARRVLKPRIRELFAFSQAIADPEAIEEHHRARIAAKRLRYTLERFPEVYGLPGAQAIETLKDVQKSLGQIHDADVRMGLVQSGIVMLSDRGVTDPDLLTGYEQLAERFRRSRRREHAALAGSWRRQSSAFREQLRSLTR
jgi:exopolyphosphatase/guanosine-5'-triphosphate,3'-diphosphate pyrophosphatase